jgi:hypothetical protein
VGHVADLYWRRRIPLGDFVAEASLCLGGASEIALAVDNETEHVLSIVVLPTGFQLRLETGKGATARSRLIAPKNMPIARERCYVFVLEVQGEEVVASVEGATAIGRDPWFAQPKAYMKVLVAGQMAGAIDHLRIWSALPDDGWPARKAALESSSP